MDHKLYVASDINDRRIIQRGIKCGISSRNEFRMRWLEILYQLIEFGPSLIIICAGFDSHFSDPLGHMDWYDIDYYWITESVLIAARLCSNTDNNSNITRCVSILEGGYNIDYLPKCVKEHIDALFLSPYSHI